MPKDSVQEFLDRIAKIESSDNYLAAHRTMKGGLHRGMAAVGRYGVMPLTIAEMVQKKSTEDQNSPQTAPQQADEAFVGPTPELEGPQFEPGEHQVAALSRFLDPRFGSSTPQYRESAATMGRMLSEDPDAQDYIARRMATDLLQKTGGDQDRAAYMWTMGHNLSPGKVTPEKLDSSDYVRKFRSLEAKDSDVPQLVEEVTVRKRFPGTNKLLNSKLSTKKPMYMDEGGVVPGEASHPGDDPRNDVVPTMLSAGEVVLPRTVAKDPQAAAQFVQHLNHGGEVGCYSQGGLVQPPKPPAPSKLHGTKMHSFREFSLLNRFLKGR